MSLEQLLLFPPPAPRVRCQGMPDQLPLPLPDPGGGVWWGEGAAIAAELDAKRARRPAVSPPRHRTSRTSDSRPSAPRSEIQP